MNESDINFGYQHHHLQECVLQNEDFNSKMLPNLKAMIFVGEVLTKTIM